MNRGFRTPDTWPRGTRWVAPTIGTLVLGAGVQASDALGQILPPLFPKPPETPSPSPIPTPAPTLENTAPQSLDPRPEAITTRQGNKARGRKPRFRVPRFIVPAANEASGYIIANAVDDDMIVMSDVIKKDHHKRKWVLSLLVHNGQEHDNECVWVDRAAVRRASSRIKLRQKPNICKNQAPRLADRNNIGQDFNCGEHVCDDGKVTRIREKCKTDEPRPLNYSMRKGKSYDKLPPLRMMGGFHYRYTTPDGKKAVGRAKVRLPRSPEAMVDSVWVQIPESCIIGDRKGGPKLNYGEHTQSAN